MYNLHFTSLHRTFNFIDKRCAEKRRMYRIQKKNTLNHFNIKQIGKLQNDNKLKNCEKVIKRF